jgi:hypothetical protein
MSEAILKSAASLLDVRENCFSPFSATDIYNDNKLDGFICHQADHNYGAIVITQVNDRDCFQKIYGTPKLHYPFTSDLTGKRTYRWPWVEQLIITEKIDGTNICVYRYYDANGNTFTTAKTRLTPVLRSFDTINFKALWDRILKKYSIFSTPELDEYSLSFELYGYLNPLLVKYELPIDAKLLFMVRQRDHSIHLGCSSLPSELINPQRPYHGPLTIDGLTQAYEALREEAHSKNKVSEDQTSVEGIEGFVLYLKSPDSESFQMYKAKPEEIEDIHWASKFISNAAIYTTAKNFLESNDINTLSGEGLRPLLEEEFSKEQIETSADRITKVIGIVYQEYFFDQSVLSSYLSCFPQQDIREKATILRAMSKDFKKIDMKRVYQSLAKQDKFDIVI